jgi:hypothetical protein
MAEELGGVMNKPLVKEIAEMLLPRVLARATGKPTKEHTEDSDAESTKAAVARLSAWLFDVLSPSLLGDHETDALEIVSYCADLLRQLPSEELVAILWPQDSVAPTSRPSQVPLFLPHTHIDVPSAMVYHQVRSAVATKSFFRAEGTPYPTARLISKEIKGEAQLKPTILDDRLPVAPHEEEKLIRLMWQQREELSDFDSDIWDYSNSKWLEKATRAEDFVTITVSELLAMRGFTKKRNGRGQPGGYKRSQREQAVRSIVHLQNVWLNLFEFGIDRKRQFTPSAIQERAIKIKESGQLNLEGDLDLRSFTFRPGILFSNYLLGPGRQIALLAARALTYSPCAQCYEKRLARYLSWQWRIKASRSDYLVPYHLETLLKAISLEMDRRFPGRTRSRLERALDTLERDGVVRAWQYQLDRTQGRKVHWANEWLQSTVLIEPPELIFDRYQKIGQKRRDVVEISALPQRLRDRRRRAKMSILVAAEQSGVSPQEFLSAESGRSTEDSVRNKLEEWLERTIAS